MTDWIKEPVDKIADKVQSILIEEGQTNSNKYGFHLGDTIKFSPTEVAEIIKKRTKNKKIIVELNEDEAELVRFALYKQGRSLHETYGVHQEVLDCYNLIERFCFKRNKDDTDNNHNK